ncbi:MAG: cell division protein ZapA [Clostridia bacterium]|nr:cell division protein ZapA [Clostridia bacterium]
MAEKNHVQVMIEGKLMTLVGTDSPEYMKSVAEYIDNKNKELRSGENGKRMNVAMASILTSINVADDFFKEKERRESLERELENMKQKLEDNERELDEARKEIEQLNRDIYILKDDMNMLAEEKAQVEDQLDEYFVALDASKNITHKNRNRQ